MRICNIISFTITFTEPEKKPLFLWRAVQAEAASLPVIMNEIMLRWQGVCLVSTQEMLTVLSANALKCSWMCGIASSELLMM